MTIKTIKEKNYSLQIVGVLLFLAGAAMMFIFPIGTIAGLAVIVVSARLGFKKYKAWHCDGCGHHFKPL